MKTFVLAGLCIFQYYSFKPLKTILKNFLQSSKLNHLSGLKATLDWCWCLCVCLTAPSSPVHNRRLLSARNMRMSSVELPDDNEKSLSSASTSPCPSPVIFQPSTNNQHNMQKWIYIHKLTTDCSLWGDGWG